MGLNIVLFVLTLATTLVAGTALVLGVAMETPGQILAFFAGLAAHPERLLQGLTFSLPLLAILGIHEMGHYVAARRHKVTVTLPFFIPFLPLPPLPGTMGALIKIRSPIPNRNALLDIGAAGPLVGAAVAIPVLLVGLKLSVVRQVVPGASGVPLGESVLFKILAWVALGDIPAQYDVVLHPAAYAGWLGLYITMLNLVPAGQLDGGHIAYAVFGGGYTRVARLMPYALLFLGLLYPGWFMWALLLFVLGTRHPTTVFDDVPLSPARRAVGIAAAALFVLCFTPNPFPTMRP